MAIEIFIVFSGVVTACNLVDGYHDFTTTRFHNPGYHNLQKLASFVYMK